MTQIVYDLPPPPEGEEWCTGCVMLLRGQIDKEHDSEVAVLARDGKDEVKLIKPRVRVFDRLRLACVIAPFFLAPELGLMRLCWTCAAGIEPARVSALATPNGLPPGQPTPRTWPRSWAKPLRH